MKDITLIRRIEEARQRLEELSDLRNDPLRSEMRQAVDLVSGVLDEIKTLVIDAKRAGNSGYENEIRFNVLAEAAADAIISIDDQSTILYVNPAAGRMFGYELVEMVGKNLTCLMPGHLRQIHLASVKRYITKGQRHIDWRAVELTGLHKSGQEFPIEVSFADYIGNGRRFFTGFVRDISSRKRAEEALRASEQRLQAIVDNTTAVIFLKDLESRYLLVNREYERLYHVERDQVRGSTDFDFHPIDVAEAVRANDRQVIEAGAPMQFEESVPSDGNIRHYVVVKFLLRDHLDKPYAVCGIATDITALKHAEELRVGRARREALRADIHATFCGGAEGDLRTMLQCSAEAIGRHFGAAFSRIWTLDDQENMLELQASAGQYTGLDGEHARVPVGNLGIGLIVQERTPLLTNDLQNDKRLNHPERAKREGMVAFAGYPLVVEGRLVGVLAIFARKLLEQDTLEALASVADTIAQGIERKRTEEKLQESEQALRAREAELAHATRVMTMGEVTSSIAHEINQPLGAIVNYGNACLRLLKDGSTDLATVTPALSAIVQDANRASSVIARIRALAKKSTPEIVAVSLKDVVADVLAVVRQELTQRRIVLSTDLSEDLSPVLGDRIQLQQVLLNLVMNGIEAMSSVPEDERRLSICARSHLEEGEQFVLMAVQDSGIGLRPEQVPRLFETFYTTKVNGMGMGLAISRSIVQALGGRLRVVSNGGPGATFQFILPAQNRGSLC